MNDNGILHIRLFCKLVGSWIAGSYIVHDFNTDFVYRRCSTLLYAK